MKKIIFIFLFIFSVCASQAARVSGIVLSDDGQVLIGANVYWANTGNGTITDLDGRFSLQTISETNKLVCSYMGYHNDTTIVHGKGELTIVLVSDLILDEVTITERKLGVIKSRVSAFDTQTLDGAELCKAACCNLSEAFETNASVDVAYSDAATGAKTIKMLGLSGTYVQLLHENTPGIRGLGQSFGMEYIPGPWMSSIQVSKGTSSVINGYEATTGQINVEFLKPQTQDPISVNAMINSELHAELNVEGGWQIPLKEHEEHEEEEHEHGDHCHHKKLHTGILAHWQQGFMQMDENHDTFYEMPKSTNINLANRWVYTDGKYTFQAFVRGLYDRRIGGQTTTRDSLDESGSLVSKLPIDNPYKIDLNTWRIDGYMKNGYIFNEETGSSLGIIAAASYHNQANRYGLREWNANQTNAYLNALTQFNFEGSPRLEMDNDHRLTVGLSVNYDGYREQLLLPLQAADTALDRWELTPGIFAEYNLKLEDKLSLVAGLRMDYSTMYGVFFTPRVNVRYSPWEWWTIRASAGMGYRSPNAIADNAYMLPSSRTIVLQSAPEQERAVNAGVSTTFYVPIGSRELQLSGEYYYTGFQNCLVADMDQSANAVYLYNLSDIRTLYKRKAESYAQTMQVEATMEILRGWTLTAAFRYTDVKQTTLRYALNDKGENVLTPSLRQKPLTNTFKGIITTSYQTPLKKWQFDFTAQFNGGGRMPDGFNSYFINNLKSSQYVEKDGSLYYKWYPQLMAQITKYWRTCSLYVGAENMTNFRQENPVIGADAPYEAGFDASMAWGPITGWKVYAGFRWSLGKEE